MKNMKIYKPRWCEGYLTSDEVKNGMCHHNQGGYAEEREDAWSSLLAFEKRAKK